MVGAAGVSDTELLKLVLKHFGPMDEFGCCVFCNCRFYDKHRATCPWHEIEARARVLLSEEPRR